MPSHAERVRRNYYSPADSVSEVRQRLFEELRAWVVQVEGEKDATALRAAVDAVAVAATTDEMSSSLDALDSRISKLKDSGLRTLLTRTLNALRATVARKAS
jgi:hypothetical protein